jgi:hypothetical protein
MTMWADMSPSSLTGFVAQQKNRSVALRIRLRYEIAVYITSTLDST